MTLTRLPTPTTHSRIPTTTRPLTRSERFALAEEEGRRLAAASSGRMQGMEEQHDDAAGEEMWGFEGLGRPEGQAAASGARLQEVDDEGGYGQGREGMEEGLGRAAARRARSRGLKGMSEEGLGRSEGRTAARSAHLQGIEEVKEEELEEELVEN
ncbi:hypothetical protein HK104_003528 [Borealophlyctis nickersoniae]|nr:hypothetical protein HK104_003528 [Borealophlyctis nickersoniae]